MLITTLQSKKQGQYTKMFHTSVKVNHKKLLYMSQSKFFIELKSRSQRRLVFLLR